MKDNTVFSNAIRLDVRAPSRGGRILHGAERISPVAEKEDAEVKLKVGDANATGWKVTEPQYATTQLNDDWHDFTLTEGENTAMTRLLVLNGDDVVIHEGVLSKNETWFAGKVHVVRHWVRVPENVTLTIEAKAVVKFCEDTGILVDGKLTANGAVFTFVSDDSIGGDTDRNGASYMFVYKMYEIIGNGEIDLRGSHDCLSYDFGETDDSKSSATVRLDGRTSIGGSILHGTEFISPVSMEEDATIKLKVGDAYAAGWNVIEPQYVTSKLDDGWHEFGLTEDGADPKPMLILNGSDVVIHEGILSQNEKWAVGKVHVVRHWIRVPENVMLTIESNAVVKFCEDTGILVDGTLMADGAIFTTISDDGVGGDTDMNGPVYPYVFKTYAIIGDEEHISMNGCINSLSYNLSIANGEGSSVPTHLDVRTSIGGRMLHGMEFISPVVEGENDNVKLTVDGVELTKWGVESPWIDSTKMSNDWHVFTLNEGYKTFEAELLHMNRNDVIVHEGVLEENETWTTDKLHVVRHWVRVPQDITLTIEPKAIVKFCEDTGILVEGTLKGDKAIFTSIMDDSDGDDTDMNGRSVSVGYGFYDITGDGKIELTDCDNRGLASLVDNTIWKTGEVIHIVGQLKVPSGVSLTIQPGAVVKFATGASLVADGGVISSQDALFTHVADDSEEAGGDTNGDGEATAPVHDAYVLPAGFEPDGSGKDSNGNEIRYITPQPYTGGTIKNGETKILAGNRVHKVTGNITIANGGKLVVQPGAIIKMKEGGLITVNEGGMLEALGNRFQPIIFTSIKDDDHGGDTNGDGFSFGTAGDWRVVYVHGHSDMNYCQLFYGGNTSDGTYNDADCGIVSISSTGSMSMDNCLISDSIFEGIKSFGHDVVVTNTVIQYCNRGVNTRGSNLHKFVNCIAYGCEVGFMEDGPSTFVVNCIACECTQQGFWPYYDRMTIQNSLIP